MRKKDLIVETQKLQKQLKEAHRIIAELNLRLGNNQKIDRDILENDLDRDLTLTNAYLSMEKILTTITKENYLKES